MLPIKLAITDARDLRLMRFSLEAYCGFLDDTALDDSITDVSEIRENQHLSDPDLREFLNGRIKQTMENISRLLATRKMLHAVNNFDGCFPLMITATTKHEVSALYGALDSYSCVVEDSVTPSVPVTMFRKMEYYSDDKIKQILMEQRKTNDNTLDDLIAITGLLDCIK